VGFFETLSRLDRRVVYILIFIGTFVPFVIPLGLPVNVTPPVQSLFDKIESLEKGDYILVSFDYGPTTYPENAPMATAVMRHAFVKELKVIVIALFPLGSFTMAEQELGQVAEEFSDTHQYGIDYVNLGYKDGAQAVMKQLGEDFNAIFPTDNRGTAFEEIPLFQEALMSGDSTFSYDDLEIVCSFATGIIGEWWANLVNAQFGTPVAVGCTAVSAPKYYAYYNAGQMLGLLGGLKGASEYERLLTRAYGEQEPRIASVYSDPMVYTASKAMDVQTIDHTIIIIFIILGNIAFFISTRREKKERLSS
jgi:hypothetical protein